LAANQVKLDSYVPDANKKRKMDGEYADFSLEALISTGVSEVGPVKPVDDFKDMLTRRDVDMVDKAIEGMKKRVIQLVNESVLNKSYPKALECLTALREGCIQEEESEAFNKFLIEVRGFFEGKRRDEFWKQIQSKKITLIDCTESEDSSVSMEEASKFLTAPKKSIEIAPKPPSDNTSTDDLFAMIE